MKSKILPITIVLITVVLGVVAAVFLFRHAESKEKSVTTESPSQAISDTIYYQDKEYEYNHDITNILFLGIDKEEPVTINDSPGLGGQADCIMILSLNREEKTAKILQISRDCMTEIDIYDANGNYYTSVTAQLATQYAYGNGADTSCWATKKTVSELLYELPIDGYIALNIEGVPVINDAVGGVTITVPEDYTSISPEFIKGSTITLNGKQAEKYIRYRDTSLVGSNNERMKRQIHYIPALIETLKKNGEGYGQLYDSMYSLISPYFVTDLTGDRINELFEYEWDIDNVRFVEGKVVSGEEHEEFHIDEEKLQKNIIEMFYKLK